MANDCFEQKGLFYLDKDVFRLTDRFVVPPFSVLDTKQGYWQSRKSQWLDLGIASELGRGDNLLIENPLAQQFNAYYEKKKAEKAEKFGQCLPTSIGEAYGRSVQGTSIFDPVLCELIYRWFCPSNSSIFDPFAGGSVRGIVASFLGHSYTGIDLSKQQIEANEVNYTDVSAKMRKACKKPKWFNGDSRNCLDIINEEQDLIFTCPPYFNLEKYSNDPNDISALNDYNEFLLSYKDILTKSAGLLRENRFFCIVVGDVRDKKSGEYLGFVHDTATILKEAGLKFYNDVILVNVAGTLPVRAPIPFIATRKLGKQHQNLLIFFKGDLNNISDVISKEFDNDQFEKIVGGK